MPDRSPVFRLSFLLAAILLLAPAPAAGDVPAGPPIIVGLDADMSKGSAQGGEAIRRGMVLAVDEINAAGGVLGRPLQILVRDHRGSPDRGIDNIEAFAATPDLVAVVGGVHTPVAVAELPSIHRNELIYLDPWAAGTQIVDNGYSPNYVFRVSVRDAMAGGFLVDVARRRGFRRLGLLLWRTAWGRSNEAAIRRALKESGDEPPVVQWFNTGQDDMSREVDAFLAAGVDAVILVTNALDGITVVREVASRPPEERLPIISHWGISGGDFHAQARDAIAAIDLSFLQTYSFVEPPMPAKAAIVYRAYCERFQECPSPGAVPAPVGLAHAYDLVHLLALAIERAGSIDRRAVRDALESIESHDGLVRRYEPPFTPERHDALTPDDYRLSRYDEKGAIMPVPLP